MSVQYFTAEGLKKLQEELYQLRSIERPKISQQIAEARDKGDLSENAEYDAAKDAQGLLELKISKLEEVVASARLVDESKLDNTKALVLSKVKIKNKSWWKQSIIETCTTYIDTVFAFSSSSKHIS